MKLPASYCEKLPSIEGWHSGGPQSSAPGGGGPAAGRSATSSPASSALLSRAPAGSRGGFMKP